jgi:hypothetical protein
VLPASGRASQTSVTCGPSDLAARRHVEGEEPRTAQVIPFPVPVGRETPWPGADPDGYVIELPDYPREE